MTQRILIAAPAFNEEEILPQFFEQFHATRARVAPAIELRLLIVDDGSVDRTLSLLREQSRLHPGVVGYVALAANFGHQKALIAGLCEAGNWPEAIITMDADLEHPFEVIPALVSEWASQRAVVVHAVRRPTRKLPWLKRWPSAMFYRLTAALTGLDLAPGQADFRLWDAGTVRSVSSYLPHVGSLRVFAAWLRGRKGRVAYDQVVQAGRRSRFTLQKNVELASHSIIGFSDLPLKAITLIGAIGLAFSMVYGVFVAIALMRGQTVPGYASTVLIVMTMGCLQLLSIGILAAYLRRLVFSRALPPFVIRERHLDE